MLCSPVTVVLAFAICTVSFAQEADEPVPIRTLSPIRPKGTLSPILPKTESTPVCSRPFSQVTVPAAGSVTFSSPGLLSPNSETVCGWVFRTTGDATLSINCAIFDMRMREVLLVTERPSGIKTSYERTNGPHDEEFPASMLNVAFRYGLNRKVSKFVCKVTPRSNAVASDATNAVEPTPVVTAVTTKAPAIVVTKPPTTKSCQCGIPNRSSRIVGGVNTEQNEYPWQAGLVDRGTRSVFCGGTLINNRFILSAAHCTPDLTPSNFEVLLGAYSTKTPSLSEIVAKPIKIINHSQYNANTFDYDMALIEITPLNFTDPNVKVRPACLPDSVNLYENVMATVSGWGTLSSGGSQPSIQQEVTLPTVSTANCRAVYGTAAITSRMLCAGTGAGGKDSCQGDSGGPLVAPDGPNYEIIGVVSFGAGCGDPGVPGVYTRVTALQSWITSNTAGATTCPR